MEEKEAITTKKEEDQEPKRSNSFTQSQTQKNETNDRNDSDRHWNQKTTYIGEDGKNHQTRKSSDD